MCGLSTFGTLTSHRHTQTHKTYHNSDLGEFTTFPLIVFFVPVHVAYTLMSFCPIGSFEILEIGTPMILEACNFLYRPLIEMMLLKKL
jgi:hypothetical protein